ncbi:GMC oxidoreductase [Amycolatopsis alba]
MGVLWRGSCPQPLGSEVSTLVPPEEHSDSIHQAYQLLGIPLGERPDNLTAELCSTLITRLDINQGIPPSSSIRALPIAATNSPDGTRWTGPDVILAGIAESPRSNVSIRASTHCRKVLLRGDRAVGVEVVDLESKELYQIHAQVIVLAADAFRTPQILYNSGIRPAHLGRHFNDHLQVTLQVVLSQPLQEVAAVASQQVDLGAQGCWIPFADESRPFHGQVLYGFQEDLRSERPLAVTAGISLYGRKEITGDDRVILHDTQRDIYDMPTISLHYRWTRQDRKTIDHLKLSALDIAHQLGVPSRHDPNVLPPGASLHYQGTMRMGATELESVCDAYGRVHTLSNVYVGGGGLIETSTACNPTLTAVALAHRSAKRISIEMKGGSKK